MAKHKPLPTLIPVKRTSIGSGRISGYKEEYCDKLIEIASSCEPYNYANICAVELGICRDTLWEWRQKHKSFSDAYKEGLQIWERRLNLEAINSKMDFKFYRSFIFRVLGENCEPSTKIEQESHITVEGLQALQHLNRN